MCHKYCVRIYKTKFWLFNNFIAKDFEFFFKLMKSSIDNLDRNSLADPEESLAKEFKEYYEKIEQQ